MLKPTRTSSKSSKRKRRSYSKSSKRVKSYSKSSKRERRSYSKSSKRERRSYSKSSKRKRRKSRGYTLWWRAKEGIVVLCNGWIDSMKWWSLASGKHSDDEVCVYVCVCVCITAEAMYVLSFPNFFLEVCARSCDRQAQTRSKACHTAGIQTEYQTKQFARKMAKVVEWKYMAPALCCPSAFAKLPDLPCSPIGSAFTQRRCW